MKVVSPYRPIEPYTSIHIEITKGGFDWIDALRMLRCSALLRTGAETFAITDTDLPVPHYRYQTREPMLMLWILEVSLAYLRSEDFDQDTAFICPDNLVLKPLDGLFGKFDIGLTSRPPKFIAHPLMNSFQLWPVASKTKLIELYTRALEIGKTLSHEQQRWGGDTTPLIMLLGPIEPGLHMRELGTRVMIYPPPTLNSIGVTTMNKMRTGRAVKLDSAVVDFKCAWKLHMREFYERVFGENCERLGVPG